MSIYESDHPHVFPGGSTKCKLCSYVKQVDEGPKPLAPAASSAIIPDHYGGRDDPYEVFKVIRAWEVNFFLGNALKYIRRAGKKDPAKQIEDLEKAAEYLRSEIEDLKSKGRVGVPWAVDTYTKAQTSL